MTIRITVLTLFLALLISGVALLAISVATADGPDGDDDEPPAPTATLPWAEILDGADVDLPEPLEEVEWREDFTRALAEAKRTNRPLLVTMRCLPCRQCSEFDAEVLEQGNNPADPYLRQFVTVRLTTMEGLDLRYFPVDGYQDLDISWWGYLMSPHGRIYAIYGGRDEVSDKTRISIPSFIEVMKRVLAFHYDDRRAEESSGWMAAVGAEPPRRVRYNKPSKLPGYRSWKKHAEEFADACFHCHQVGEILRQPAIDSGDFNPFTDLRMWPLPENVGITLDRDHGLKITVVKPDSAAATLGLRPGDVLGGCNGTRLFSQTDFRGILHRGPGLDAEFQLVWKRGDELMTGTLVVTGDWRQTVLDWRMTISGGNIGMYPCFWALKSNSGDRRRAGVSAGEMCIKPWLGRGTGKGPAWDAGLRNRHFVIAVNGEKPDVDGRSFQTWFRFRNNEGDTVELTIRDNGTIRKLTYKLERR